MNLQGEHVHLRPLEAGDTDGLLEILTDPEISEWWPGYDRDRVERELVRGADDDEVWLAIELDGRLIGLVGYYEQEEPEYRSAGLDVTLHPDFIGRGLGAEALRTLARWLFDERGHHRLTIDPAANNPRAIRCYERVGFKPVGVMRRYERLLADGSFRDALLMDLLAEELTD